MFQAETPHKKTTSFEYLLLPVSAYLFFLCLQNANWAFGLMYLITPIGVYQLIQSFRKRKVFSKKSIYLRCLCGLILLISAPMAIYIQKESIISEIDPLASQLDDYKQQHGHYPADLSPLGLKQSTRCHHSAIPLLYLPDPARLQFSISCPYYGFSKLSYRSDTRQWHIWD